MPAYVAGLLSGLPRMASLADAKSPELLRCEMEILPGARFSAGAAPLGRIAGCTPLAASVLLADRVLELPGREISESSPQLQKLAASPLWEAWDSCRMQRPLPASYAGREIGKMGGSECAEAFSVGFHGQAAPAQVVGVENGIRAHINRG